MNYIKLISDSTSDLSPELKDAYDVSILPLHVLLDEEEHLDGVDITPDELYVWSDKTDRTPKTSAPAVEDAVTLFGKALEEYEHIIAFSISGGMSASGQIMRMAAEELQATDRIHVIDSANLSTGIGLLILGAGDMIKERRPIEEILSWIEEKKPYVRASFVLDTLVYLHRGGRCSGMAALAGGMLKLHPRIAVVDGAMRPENKYRGKRNSVIFKYVKDMEPHLRNAEPAHVFITHSGIEDDFLAELREYLVSLGVFETIHITRAGSVISSHCGPGCLGVLFIEKPE